MTTVQRDLGGDVVGDILSQHGNRGPRRWPRLVAILALLALVTIAIVVHFPYHPGVRAGPSRTAVTMVPLPGPADGSDGVPGLAMSRDDSLRLPATGEHPAWLWPATGRLQPIGGLPGDRAGYRFTRVAGGWAVQADDAARLRCASCAGPRLPVYFLADHAQSVIRVGTADEVAPGAAAGAMWLTSYPQGADMSTAAGTAQEITATAKSAGPQVRLPAGDVIYRGTDRGLLLAPAAPSARPAIRQWSPAAPRATGRTFTGVLAASADQVAWATPCDPVCRVEALDLATGQHTVVRLPGASSAVNGAFSPDGKFLALQVSFDNLGDNSELAMQLDVVSLASSTPAAARAIRVSSDALVGFGWPVGSDRMVAELNFLTKFQVASWRPGEHRPVVAVINPGPHSASLIVG